MYPGMIRAALAIVVIAGASLLLPWEPVFDPWGWLVWGREAGALDLDTSGGPSWKPLPVLFTTVFSPFPTAAPELWLFVARVGWLAAVALAALLAARLASRRGAGREERFAAAAIAGIGVVLLADGFTPWLRQFAGGLSEPLLTALVLAAVERGLAGRSRAALALAVAAALLRPEAWPFLIAYATWLWRREPAMRAACAVAIGAVAALWVVPDLLGSGSALTGADRAREGTGSAPVEALEVLMRAAALPLAALWVGFGLAVADARRRDDRAVLVLAAGALAWIALVAVMAAGGYAGLPRFVAPAIGVVCALGSGGLAALAARALSGLRAGVRPRGVGAAIAALGIAVIGQAGIRASDLEDAASEATALGAAHDDLARIIESGGRERFHACGAVVVGSIEGQTAVAWRLDLPMDSVEVSGAPPERGVYLERTESGWRASELGCPNLS
jgi:hypothetical protein